MYYDNDNVDWVKLGLRTAPQAGLLFIPEVVYEHGDAWWNGIDRGQLLIRPSELSSYPTTSH
jgi:hypothetical protein